MKFRGLEAHFISFPTWATPTLWSTPRDTRWRLGTRLIGDDRVCLSHGGLEVRDELLDACETPLPARVPVAKRAQAPTARRRYTHTARRRYTRLGTTPWWYGTGTGTGTGTVTRAAGPAGAGPLRRPLGLRTALCRGCRLGWHSRDRDSLGVLATNDN